ncbi:hypothetical protein [Pedobacter psychrodurus]|uniref:hypothetical protein n=1 Tax=Pedobacter psychrodurus TaxID=2530456 RepID=UPI00292FA19E|nr:hypothetical protein [Pedobacter psychrodurus]
MIRKGRIQTIDKFSGTGVIVDENDQEISFSVEDLIEWPIKSAEVAFDIALTALGLMAIDIIPLHQMLSTKEKAELIPADLSETVLEAVFIHPNGKV